MIYYLAQLTALCKGDPVGTKVVFVPSQQVGHNVTTALAATGTAWANLHLTTPTEWARQRVLPQLQADGWTPLLPNYDLFFIGELVEKTLEDAQATYFTRTESRAAIARAFLNTFQELRLAGVQPEILKKKAGEQSKIRELAVCYEAYVGYLQQQRYYDDALIYATAIERIENEGTSEDTYALFDETPIAALPWRYIEVVSAGHLQRIGRSVYGRPVPHQSAATYGAASLLVDANEDVIVGVGGQVIVGEAKAIDKEQLSLVHVLGAEEEVRFVFRDILANAYPLDQVEIAYTTDSPYLSLLHDTVEAFEIPMSFASGLPPEHTRPGQALMAYVRWIASGFDIEELIGLCQAQLLTLGRLKKQASRMPWPYEIASVLRAARIRLGRGEYTTGLKRVRSELGRQLKNNEQQGRATEFVESQLMLLDGIQAIVHDLLDKVPPGKKVQLRQLTDACQEFLKTYAPLRGGYDSDAQTGLTIHLRNIGDHIDITGSAGTLATHLLELLSQHRIEAASVQAGRVFAVPLERAGYSHRKHLYIIGMDEGSFPGRGIEDPVLLDDERRQLDLDLPLHRPRPGERVWQAERVLGMVPGRVTLLARRRTVADGSEYYPSAFFQQLEEAIGASETAKEPRSFLPSEPAEALNRLESMLASRHASGYDQAVAQAAPWLVQGAAARQARSGLLLSRYDGILGIDTPALNPARGEVLLSASRLETLVRCPYRYFLKYILHIDPPDEYEEDTTRWLNPLDFGSLLHDLLYEFMRDLKEQGEKPDRKQVPAMKAKLQEKIEKQKETTPVTHEAAYRSDVDRLEQAVEIFLRVEERQREGVDPVGFEVSFGFGLDGELNSPEPVIVQLAKDIKLLLRGRIDRVDKTDAGYVIWDYKSGSASSYKEDALQQAGSYLQWAVYAYALDEILQRLGDDQRVVRSGYFFVSAREYGRHVVPALPAPYELGDLLRPLFQLIEQGTFPHIQKESQCKYCEFNRVCGTEGVGPKRWKEMAGECGDRAMAERIGSWLDG